MSQEIERLNAILEKKNNEIGNLNKKVLELDEINMSIGGMKDKITNLVSENKNYHEEIVNAQENLRLSAQQNQKIMQ